MSDKATFGERFADRVARIVRSWTFIFVQLLFIAFWIIFNMKFPNLAFDDKSFNILRLVLTIEASFTGSILLMTQHRQSQKDRAIVYSDYVLDSKIYKKVKKLRKDLKDKDRT
jgi:uncharacterized membrane protein